MKFKTWFPILIAVLGLGMMFYVFLNQSSPYVTIREAKSTSNDHLHVAGDILPGSLSHDIAAKQLRFHIQDSLGEIAQVIYEGQIPANLSSVTKVVAIGGFEGEAFKAHRLLVKCPSKYESTAVNLPSGSSRLSSTN